MVNVQTTQPAKTGRKLMENKSKEDIGAMNSTIEELKRTLLLFESECLLTLVDVAEVVEVSTVIESARCNKKIDLQKRVMTFSDPDRDYPAALIVLNNNVMIRTCELAQPALARHEKIIYHVELWNKKESEFHHLAKNVNLKKITELAVLLC